MRKILNLAMGLVVAGSAMLSLATTASANAIAGGGYSSSYSGESAFTSAGAGETGQFSAIFFNDGTQTWQPGVVGLLVCAADKITCNISSNASYAKNWFSSTVYATVTTTVAPGSNGFFIYNFTVPTGTPPGTTTTFYGDVGLIATGAEFHPEGYFQVNTAPQPQLSLVFSPTSASLSVGQTQQFTITNLPTGAVPSWSVLGGCGAVTAAGLFAATAMNSATQPCAVLASIPGATGSAPITVFGQATSLGCSASPTTLIANGGTTAAGKATITIALKDANGNTVSNASSPNISAINVTPSLATMTPTGTLTPSLGQATVAVTATSTPGDIQLSASAVGLTGCNVIITSGGVGSAAKTVATFLTNPIASDSSSTSSMQIDVSDANGNRVASDNSTVLTITRDAGSTNVCNVTGVTTGSGGSTSPGGGTATAASGRVAFTVQSTSTPGQCLMIVTTNNATIAGTTATLTTLIVGSPNTLAIESNDSPHNASASGTCVAGGSSNEASCTTIVVLVRDVNGNIVTSDSGRTITPSFGGNCAGSGGGSVSTASSTTTSGGKATFTFRSQGAYSGCSITFTSAGISSVTTNAVWNAGPANHLACTFSPNPIPPDNTATSGGVVSVVDSFGNVVTNGVYSVNFARISGSATVQVTAGPQNTNGGYATFIVRSSNSTGSDTYGPSLSSGSLSGSNTTCQITVQ